jgi:putative transposase
VKVKLRDDRAPTAGLHNLWATDFARDQLATGGKIRILRLPDTYSRYAHATHRRAQYRVENVVAKLEAVCGKMSHLKTIRVDKISEFEARDLDLRAYTHKVVLDFSRLGKPTDNAFIEALNGRLRAEFLNAH